MSSRQSKFLGPANPTRPIRGARGMFLETWRGPSPEIRSQKALRARGYKVRSTVLDLCCLDSRKIVSRIDPKIRHIDFCGSKLSSRSVVCCGSGTAGRRSIRASGRAPFIVGNQYYCTYSNWLTQSWFTPRLSIAFPLCLSILAGSAARSSSRVETQIKELTGTAVLVCASARNGARSHCIRA